MLEQSAHTHAGNGLGKRSARLRDGRVSCWGEPDLLGAKPQPACQADFCPPQPVGITDAIAITAGFDTTCAIHVTGKVSCWGIAVDGRNGSNPTTTCTQHVGVVQGKPVTLVRACDPTPVDIAGLTDATSVSIGTRSPCAVRKTGAVACWGLGELVSGSRSACATIDNAPAQCVLAATDVEGVVHAAEVAVGECPESSVVCGGGPARHLTSPATKRLMQLTYTCSLGADGVVHCAWSGHPELATVHLN